MDMNSKGWRDCFSLLLAYFKAIKCCDITLYNKTDSKQLFKIEKCDIELNYNFMQFDNDTCNAHATIFTDDIKHFEYSPCALKIVTDTGIYNVKKSYC